MAVDCEKQLARCVASKVVYCGGVNNSVALELRKIAQMIKDGFMGVSDIEEYCIERANDLELRARR